MYYCSVYLSWCMHLLICTSIFDWFVGLFIALFIDDLKYYVCVIYTIFNQGRIYSQQGPVQKKMWGRSTGSTETILPGKKTENWRPFLVITMCQMSLILKNWRPFFAHHSCLLASRPLISGMQQFTAPFVGPLFVIFSKISRYFPTLLISSWPQSAPSLVTHYSG